MPGRLVLRGVGLEVVPQLRRQRVLRVGVRIKNVPQLIRKGHIKNRTVQRAVRHLIVQDTGLTDPLQLRKEFADHILSVNMQPHPNGLQRLITVLIINKGNIHMMPADHLQHRPGRADPVRDQHLYQNNLLIISALRQIPVLIQLLTDGAARFIGSLNLQENRVHVNALIVIDPVDTAPVERNNITYL